jgi:hypothetical protein
MSKNFNKNIYLKTNITLSIHIIKAKIVIIIILIILTKILIRNL